MRMILSASDRERMERLIRIQKDNARMLKLTAAYLMRRPRWVDAADVDQVTACGVTAEQAVIMLMGNGMGLDEQDLPEDRRLVMEYLWPAVRRLDAEKYRKDPYFSSIRVPEKQSGRWSLGKGRYAPYEAFVRGGLVVKEDFLEIPQIGYFDQVFEFPAVFEGGREWMTVTPNEIETMREAVGQASGDVVVFGLGLGYYAYMVSEKENVRSVAVVERDAAVIELFREHILPQFRNRDKIEIVQADAFDFVRTGMGGGKYDLAFADLWHDVADGVGLYLRMKRMEREAPCEKFLYWIEESILSNLRFRLFWAMTDALRGESPEELGRLTGVSEIRSFDTAASLLAEDSLRIMAAQQDAEALFLRL